MQKFTPKWKRAASAAGSMAMNHPSRLTHIHAALAHRHAARHNVGGLKSTYKASMHKHLSASKKYKKPTHHASGMIRVKAHNIQRGGHSVHVRETMRKRRGG